MAGAGLPPPGLCGDGAWLETEGIWDWGCGLIGDIVTSACVVWLAVMVIAPIVVNRNPD